MPNVMLYTCLWYAIIMSVVVFSSTSSSTAAALIAKLYMLELADRRRPMPFDDTVPCTHSQKTGAQLIWFGSVRLNNTLCLLRAARRIRTSQHVLNILLLLLPGGFCVAVNSHFLSVRECVFVCVPPPPLPYTFTASRSLWRPVLMTFDTLRIRGLSHTPGVLIGAIQCIVQVHNLFARQQPQQQQCPLEARVSAGAHACTRASKCEFTMPAGKPNQLPTGYGQQQQHQQP